MVGALTAALTPSSPQYRPLWSKYVTMTNVATRVRNNHQGCMMKSRWHDVGIQSWFITVAMVTIFLTCHDDKHCYKGEKQYQDIIAPSRSQDDIAMTMMSSRDLDSDTMVAMFRGEKSKGCLAVAKQASNCVGKLFLNLFWGFTTFGQNMLLCSSCLLFIPPRWHVYCLYSDVQNMELKSI